MTKIAIVSPYVTSLNDLHHYQSQQVNLGLELTKLGLQVDIITARRAGEQAPVSSINGKMRIFECATIAKWSERFLKQPVMLGLWKQLSRENYDFIQSSEYHTLTTLLAALYVIFKRSRLIIYQGIYSHSSKPLVRFAMVFYGMLFGPILRRVCYKAVCKTSQAAAYLNRGGLTQTKVIPVGVNTSLFYPGESRGSRFQLLSVGNLIPLKNYPLILKVYQRLFETNPDFELTIIGTGPEKKYIDDFIEQNGLKEKVHLLEKVPNRQMREIYNKAGLLLLFSKIEIFGMVMLEAMACGCPVVSTPVPGALDVITDGANGYIITSTEAVEIARQISQILADSAQYEAVRANAIKTAHEQYAWSVIAGQYHDLYLETANC